MWPTHFQKLHLCIYHKFKMTIILKFEFQISSHPGTHFEFLWEIIEAICIEYLLVPTVHIWCQISIFPATSNSNIMHAKGSPKTPPTIFPIFPYFLTACLEPLWREEHLGKFCCVKPRCVRSRVFQSVGQICEYFLNTNNTRVSFLPSTFPYSYSIDSCVWSTHCAHQNQHQILAQIIHCHCPVKHKRHKEYFLCHAVVNVHTFTTKTSRVTYVTLSLFLGHILLIHVYLNCRMGSL